MENEYKTYYVYVNANSSARSLIFVHISAHPEFSNSIHNQDDDNSCPLLFCMNVKVIHTSVNF